MNLARRGGRQSVYRSSTAISSRGPWSFSSARLPSPSVAARGYMQRELNQTLGQWGPARPLRGCHAHSALGAGHRGGAHFIQLCNQTRTPLLFIQTSQGSWSAPATNKVGSSRMVPSSSTRSPTPRYRTSHSWSVQAIEPGITPCRAAPTSHVSYSAGPTHRIAVMGGKQLAGVLSIIQRNAAQKAGRPFD